VSQFEFTAYLEPLRTFIEERHLDGRATLTDDAPLLEWGVIDSLALVDLLAFIEVRFALSVPLATITPENFRTLTTIATMLGALAGDTARDAV
jgi:acyl carrier protein